LRQVIHFAAVRRFGEAQKDGAAVQDPGLGRTPTGYLIYDSSDTWRRNS
jgi:hypothetical protein